MICTKCNNEIPDGAKFCPSCGAVAASAPAPESEKKFYCEKCGLELMKGAKFCSVCGGNGVAREASPAESGIAAVNLNKPSESDSLVSAMNGANAAPSNGVPMPSNGIPMPVNGSSSSEAGSASASSSGYSVSDPVIPPYVASVSADAQAPVMPMPTASGAAAVPVKKKNGGKIVLISVLAVLAVLIAATLVMFFTNRASFLSTLMGKSKYATMVEGTSIKNATDKLDIPALTNGIKAASGTYQSLSNVYGRELLGSYVYSSDASGAIKPMSYSSSSYSGPEADLTAFSEEMAKLLKDTYGFNTISESLSMNVELSESTKALLADEMYYDVDIDEILSLINGTTVNYTLTAKDNKTAITMGTQGKLAVDVKVLLDGQDAYIALPFASDKAIMLSIPKPTESVKTEVKALELDEKELERLITECVEIYLDHYKAASIEMENGEIKAGGVAVEGKLITAEFKGEQLSKLFADIAKHIVNDDYLMTEIVDYANSLGAETTKKELIDAALEEIEDSMDADDDDRLVIETVIDRNGNVLGKSLRAMNKNDVLCEISYAETDNQFGFEIDNPDFDELSNVKVTFEKKDDENGSCRLRFTSDEKTVSLVLNYSDCKKAEFCGKEIPTGKLSIGMTLPEEFSDQLGKENFAAINGTKLNIAIASAGANTIEYSIGVDVPNYGSVSLKDVFTAMDDESALSKPSNVIDITSAMTSGPDQATMTALSEFGNEIVEALKKALPDFIADEMGLSSSYPGYPTYPGSGNITNDDINDLIEDIKDDMADINSALNGELSYSGITKAELESLLSDYSKLYLEVLAKGNNMTAEEFEDFEDRYFDLWYELPYFGTLNQAAGGNNANEIGGLAYKVNADMEACSGKFISIYGDILTGKISAPGAQNAFNDILQAYNEIGTYCQSLGVDDVYSCSYDQLKQIESMVAGLQSKIDSFEKQYRS